MRLDPLFLIQQRHYVIQWEIRLSCESSLSNKYATAASIAALVGDCQYPETSFVFDEQNSSGSFSSHSSYSVFLHLSNISSNKLP